MWLCEEVHTVCTYSAILTGSLVKFFCWSHLGPLLQLQSVGSWPGTEGCKMPSLTCLRQRSCVSTGPLYLSLRGISSFIVFLKLFNMSIDMFQEGNCERLQSLLRPSLRSCKTSVLLHLTILFYMQINSFNPNNSAIKSSYHYSLQF